MSINKAIITGNLTRDPELRQTAGGMAVLGFSVAVNDRSKNKQTGEWEDVPNFIECKMFGNRAESVSRYMAKGQKVAVEGKLRWSQWEKDGQKRSKIEVIVDEIELMSRSNTAQTDQNQQYMITPNNQSSQAYYQPQKAPQTVQQPYNNYQYQQPVQQPSYQPVQASMYDEEIPF